LQIDADWHRRSTIEGRNRRVVERAEFDARDVLEPQRRAVGIRAQDDLLELANRPCVVTEYVKACSPLIGSSANRPAANWAFCSRIAAAMSLGVRLYCATLSGRSQMRIE
jgi:hypothetical protein